MRELKQYEICLQQACQNCSINLDDDMLDKFEKYFNLLSDWNEKINLTAITQKEDVYKKHFADSIYGAKYIAPNSTLCDIGTGAGFPAVVLKIVRPDLDVLLVDALDKRIKFLNEVIVSLNLDRIKAVHFRAEDVAFKKQYLNHFDILTARAVARMATLNEYCLPFVKVGGKFLAYKSDKIDEELCKSKKSIEVLGGKNYLTHEYILDSETKRIIVEIEKTKPTDDKYPRDKNRAKTNPIV